MVLYSFFFFFSSRRRHTRSTRDWSSDVCSSDLLQPLASASNLSTWVYWVLTRQGGTLTLYRDGAQIAQRSDLPATAAATVNGYIASQTNNLYYLTGRVQDVAAYNRALSSVEVSN